MTAVDDVQLRPMRWWDAAPVHGLERQLFPRDPWSPEALWSELAGVPETRWYVVAVRGHDVVGYAGVLLSPPEADVQTLAVASNLQGGGLGGLLLAALVAEATHRGCRKLMLEVGADNKAARMLYERSGFEPVARRSRYYPDGSDALVMQRELAPEAAHG
ncbi:MAG TPA: ribosomal protein S18-alanine N-acetyltransferase [Actinomycetes bacterium]|nr:ribosomal protein S18-alanine N-acetyltransferase [Actinomycetes bacterium]